MSAELSRLAQGEFAGFRRCCTTYGTCLSWSAEIRKHLETVRRIVSVRAGGASDPATESLETTLGRVWLCSAALVAAGCRGDLEHTETRTSDKVPDGGYAGSYAPYNDLLRQSVSRRTKTEDTVFDLDQCIAHLKAAYAVSGDSSASVVVALGSMLRLLEDLYCGRSRARGEGKRGGGFGAGVAQHQRTRKGSTTGGHPPPRSRKIS